MGDTLTVLETILEGGSLAHGEKLAPFCHVCPLFKGIIRV